MKTSQVINGSYGEVWVDGSEVASVTAVEAVIEIDYEDINRPRKLSTGKKMIGWEGSGSLSFYHISSFLIKLLGDNLREGKQTQVDIIVKVDDPDALGAERISLKNVVFEDITLANWEAKSIGEREAPFFFEDWQPLDLI